MSTAVAKKNDQTGAVSAPADRIESTLGQMIEKFRAVLPPEIPAERFCRVALNALQDPRVAEVAETYEGRQSIVTECQTAATDGLLLDKREAFLNVYKTKITVDKREVWVPLAKYMPMYQGLLKLARNSPLIRDIKCDVVKAGDVFAVDKFPPAGECPITHKYPEDPFARGEVRGVYAVAEMTDGTWSNAEVMSIGDVEKIRQISPAKDKDAWKNHWPEMARKTVLRRLCKYLPKSTDGMERLQNALTREGQLPAIDHAPAVAALPRKETRAAALLGPAKAEVIDAEPVKEKAKEPAQPKQKTEAKPKQKAAAEAPPIEQGGDPRDSEDDGFWEDPTTGERVVREQGDQSDDDGI